MRRVGYRGRILAIIAGTQIAYGAAMVTGGSQSHRDAWWPVAQGQVLGLPVVYAGIIWIIVGCLVAVGVPRTQDRWHFTLAVLLTALWALAAGLFWLSSDTPGSWGPAVIYTGNAAAILVISGWPEPRYQPVPPGFTERTVE